MSKPPEEINAENAMTKANAALEEGKALRAAGKHAEALAKLESVVVSVRKHGSQGALAIHLEQVGMAALNAGGQKNLVRAQEALTETIDLMVAMGLGEHQETARVLQNLGIAFIQGEKGAKAVAPLEKALTVLERAGVTGGNKEYAHIVRLLNVARAEKERAYDSD